MSDRFQDLILRSHARTLLEHARQERARLPLDTHDRAFYLGVGAAAEEVLHPELADAHDDTWLRREPAPFQEGYLKATTAIAAARRRKVGAGGIPLPRPSARSRT
jgi:hypothetical protein